MKAYLFLAPGFEEIEAVTPADVMRRAGIQVTTVAVNNELQVTGANGMTVTADTNIADYTSAQLAEADWLVVPGGMPGASNLAAEPKVCEALKLQNDRGAGIAAICAAPAVVLAPLGLLDGRDATCYPGFEASAPEVRWHTMPAVVSYPTFENDYGTPDRRATIVTGRGPGAAMPFALRIVEEALGATVADSISSAMMYTPVEDTPVSF